MLGQLHEFCINLILIYFGPNSQRLRFIISSYLSLLLTIMVSLIYHFFLLEKREFFHEMNNQLHHEIYA